MHTNIHKYGVYRVGNHSYYNKLDALAEHIRTAAPVTWHLFEEELASVDTTKEPNEDIRDLYAARARQLRNDYDHLVLHFSGGTDSTAIVEIFQENGITIDEILVRTYGEQAAYNTNDPETPEMDQLTLPLVKHIKDAIWPDITITVKDTSTAIVDFFRSNPKWYDTPSRSILEPTWQIRGDYDRLNPDWLKMTEKGKRIAHIIGKEKPRLRCDAVGFYFQYSDKGLEAHIPARTLEVGLPHFVEMFFWHPTTVRMQIKQAHLLRREWDRVPELRATGPSALNRAAEMAMARILYGERRLPLPFISLKMQDMPDGASYGVYNAQSRWFVKDLREEATSIWLKGLDRVYSDVRSLYENKMDFFVRGLPCFDSMKHYIEYHR